MCLRHLSMEMMIPMWITLRKSGLASFMKRPPSNLTLWVNQLFQKPILILSTGIQDPGPMRSRAEGKRVGPV